MRAPARGQLSILADVGYKRDRHVFVGLYGGLGFGGGGSGTDDSYNRPASGSTLSARVGLQIQLHFLQGERLNPWIGYGLGLESTTFYASGPRGEASVSLFGMELAHLTAGVDFRITERIGLGPVLDISLAQYSCQSSTGIAEQALHQWVTLGERFVLRP